MTSDEFSNAIPRTVTSRLEWLVSKEVIHIPNECPDRSVSALNVLMYRPEHENIEVSPLPFVDPMQVRARADQCHPLRGRGWPLCFALENDFLCFTGSAIGEIERQASHYQLVKNHSE